jgi:hypothetical protein
MRSFAWICRGRKVLWVQAEHAWPSLGLCGTLVKVKLQCC